jgi:hypothetical protein
MPNTYNVKNEEDISYFLNNLVDIVNMYLSKDKSLQSNAGTVLEQFKEELQMANLNFRTLNKQLVSKGVDSLLASNIMLFGIMLVDAAGKEESIRKEFREKNDLKISDLTRAAQKLEDAEIAAHQGARHQKTKR